MPNRNAVDKCYSFEMNMQVRKHESQCICPYFHQFFMRSSEFISVHSTIEVGECGENENNDDKQQCNNSENSLMTKINRLK